MGKKNRNKNKVNLFADDSDDDKIQNLNNAHEQDVTDYNVKPKNLFTNLANEDSNNDSDEDTNEEEFIQVKSKKKDFKKQEVKLEKNTSDSQTPEVKLEKNTSESFFKKGLNAKKNKDYTNSIKYYELSIHKDSDNLKGKSSFNLGLLYEDIYDDYINAEKYYKLSLQYYNRANANLALLLWEQDKYQESLQYFKKEIKENNNFDIIYNYIDTLHNLNMNDKAMDILIKYNMFKNSDKETKDLFTEIIKLD